MKQLKKILKNNKGMTLVELIISSAILLLVISAFLSMMASAAKMFSKGSRELDVQEEAQIVTNQVGALLTDCEVYAGQVGSSIYIVDKDVVHVVSEESDGVFLSTFDNALSEDDNTAENVKTLLATNPNAVKGGSTGRALLSNRVEGLSLNTDDLEDGDVVYLSMNYKNMDREIGVNQSVYMRNKPGTSSDGGNSNPVENDYDAELNVLRYKTYNLCTLFGVSKIKTNGSNIVTSGADAGCYDFNALGTVKIKDSVSTSASSAGGCVVTCIKGGNDYKIRLSFDPVVVGLGNGESQLSTVRLQDVEQVCDYISIKGFDTHCSDVKYRISLQIGTPGSPDLVSRQTDKISISGGQGSQVNILEQDFNVSGKTFKGVFRLCLDDRSTHLIFRQTGQSTEQGKGLVALYTIDVYYKNTLLGTAKVSVRYPN
ncbi:MAG: prepilin-type N-terminal cleavage/methylation domain-containing protein [Lachnospiraceae bacterium]|nr:prepilin-type N-terminal cleavage/methylation domain-containing protein [Lachnospiraceae bacterium]